LYDYNANESCHALKSNVSFVTSGLDHGHFQHISCVGGLTGCPRAATVWLLPTVVLLKHRRDTIDQ
jgi:hypothetical protein